VRLAPAPVRWADDPRNSADDGAGTPFVARVQNGRDAASQAAAAGHLLSGRPDIRWPGIWDYITICGSQTVANASCWRAHQKLIALARRAPTSTTVRWVLRKPTFAGGDGRAGWSRLAEQKRPFLAETHRVTTRTRIFFASSSSSTAELVHPELILLRQAERFSNRIAARMGRSASGLY